MTKEEFIEAYGDVMVSFSCYYKYTFTFEGTLPDGNKIYVRYGGNSDDIYKFDVDSDTTISIRELNPYSGSIYSKKLNELISFYEY